MARRIRQIGSFDRARCRERARERWSSLRMAREHAALYERILSRSMLRPHAGTHGMNGKSARRTGDTIL
jgi:hypothetical protein